MDHVQSECNPADICRRGVNSLEELLQSTIKGKIWFTGLCFLPGSNTVIEEINLESLEDGNEEIKTKDFLIATVKQEILDFNRIGNKL